jgi:hypothetical protein
MLSTAFRQRMKDEDTTSKAQPVGNAVGIDDDEVEEEEGPLVWIPKKLVTEWKNKDGIRCLTLIIQLTGGAATSDNYGVEVKVSNHGEAFAISEVWSPLMSQILDDFSTTTTSPKLPMRLMMSSIGGSMLWKTTCNPLWLKDQ